MMNIKRFLLLFFFSYSLTHLYNIDLINTTRLREFHQLNEEKNKQTNRRSRFRNIDLDADWLRLRIKNDDRSSNYYYNN